MFTFQTPWLVAYPLGLVLLYGIMAFSVIGTVLETKVKLIEIVISMKFKYFVFYRAMNCQPQFIT